MKEFPFYIKNVAKETKIPERFALDIVQEKR